MSEYSFIDPDLLYFEELYRLKSYSQAARVIPMSNQGLRKAIARLEMETDAVLFEAGRDGVLAATPEADVLYEHVQRWKADARGLRSELTGVSAAKKTVVTLAAGIGTMWFFDYFFFEALERERNDVRLEVADYPDEIVDAALKGGELNLALTVAPFSPDFATKSLGKSRIYIWVPKNDPLALLGELSPHDLEGQPLFLLRDSKASKAVLRTLAEHGVRAGEVRYLSEAIGVYVSATQEKGLGVTVAPLAEYLKDRNDVVPVPLSRDFPSWEYGLSRRVGYDLTPEEQVAEEFVVKSAQLFKEHMDPSLFL